MLQCVEQSSLDLSHLACVTTDGGQVMIGEEKGAALLLVCNCEATGHTQPIHKVHFIICQESLSTKSANLNVMSVTVEVVNSIVSHSLHHHQFQVQTDKVKMHYNDLLYFCEVH